jgi:hypothetical protein
MPNPKALPPAAPAKLSVWADQSGTPYLVQQQPDGSTTFTPLEMALAQAQPPAERLNTDRDPLNTLLLGLVAVLGVVLLGYGRFSGWGLWSAGRCRSPLPPLRYPTQQLPVLVF